MAASQPHAAGASLTARPAEAAACKAAATHAAAPPVSTSAAMAGGCGACAAAPPPAGVSSIVPSPRMRDTRPSAMLAAMSVTLLRCSDDGWREARPSACEGRESAPAAPSASTELRWRYAPKPRERRANPPAALWRERRERRDRRARRLARAMDASAGCGAGRRGGGHRVRQETVRTREVMAVSRRAEPMHRGASQALQPRPPTCGGGA